jgi:hypothetical protein
MKRSRGPCRLCGTIAELCLSHIIPDLFIRSLEEHVTTGNASQTQPTSILLSKHEHILGGQRQRGYWEKVTGMKEYLLCEPCEGKFAIYENYFRKLFYESGVRLKKRPVGDPLAVNTGGMSSPIKMVGARRVLVDFQKMRLFVLSLVWRASVAKGDFFENCDLGQNHNNRIAKMLLASDAGSDEEYPIAIMSLCFESGGLEDIICPPRVDREGNHRVCSIIIGGFVFTVWVTSPNHQLRNQEVRLRKSGELRIPLVHARPLLEEWARQYKAAGRLPFQMGLGS